MASVDKEDSQRSAAPQAPHVAYQPLIQTRRAASGRSPSTLLQIALEFAGIEGQKIFVDLFENHLTCLLAQTLAQHPQKIRLRGKSQSLIPLMKPSLFDAVGDGLRKFFTILLAQRRSTRDDIDQV